MDSFEKAINQKMENAEGIAANLTSTNNFVHAYLKTILQNQIEILQLLNHKSQETIEAEILTRFKEALQENNNNEK
ncbi:MAG: hypothetical protein ABI855_01930 [Bacteroidota bacterium]